MRPKNKKVHYIQIFLYAKFYLYQYEDLYAEPFFAVCINP